MILRVDWVQWIRSNLGLLELLFHEKELAGGAALDPGGGEDATSQDGWRQNHGDGDDSRHLHGSRAGMFVRLQHAKIAIKITSIVIEKKDHPLLLRKLKKGTKKKLTSRYKSYTLNSAPFRKQVFPNDFGTPFFLSYNLSF